MSELQLSLKTDKSQALHQKDQQTYLPTFRRMPIAFAKGEGCKLWDVDGNEYLDVLAGIAVNSLGHAHPTVTEAVSEAAENLLHVSNFFVTEAQVGLAERLTKASGLEHVFFTNSGTESFEGAVKIARKYAHKNGRGGKIISMKNSFHGRTLAAIAAGKPKMQVGFGPMPEGFKQIPFNDIEAFKNEISDDVAAVVLEPVQGEGGINVAQQAYLEELRALCDEHNIVLMFDEIQCGMGRTGKLFAKDHFGIQPDIMTLAKALGNGVPVGAILSNRRVSSAIDFGDHGTTFGGNPLACAAGIAVFDTITEKGFLDEVTEKGIYLRKSLAALQSKFDCIKEIRGLGLMVGVDFNFEAKPLVMKMLENGVIANATADTVLRLVPPLVISREEIDHLISVLEETIPEFQNK
jgi:acetylornithine/N-succinyldiaminopimelate aminotransferase